MGDFFEFVASLLAVGFVVSPVIGFAWLMRRIHRKERAFLLQQGLINEE